MMKVIALRKLILCFLLSFLFILIGAGISTIQISEEYVIGGYHVEPFYQHPAELSNGIGDNTPIIRYFIYVTGSNGDSLRQSAILSVFQSFSNTPLREPIRYLIPLLFSIAGAGYILLRFTSEKKKTCDVPVKILDYLSNNQGARISEIVRDTQISRGSASYHLQNLVLKNQVIRYVWNGRSRYFTHSNYSIQNFQHKEIMRHPKSQMILSCLSKKPGLTRKEISELTNISNSVVYWHLRRLLASRIIVCSKSGNEMVYHLNVPDEISGWVTNSFREKKG